MQVSQAEFISWPTGTLSRLQTTKSEKLEEIFFDFVLENEKVVGFPGRWCNVEKRYFSER